MGLPALAGPTQKTAEQRSHLILIDETGCLLSPLVRRSQAPRGKTPVIRKPTTRGKVSVIAGLSLSPVRHREGLYFRTYPSTNINGERAADFLRQLMAAIRGPIVVVWDNAAIHRGRDVRELLSRTKRLTLAHLPPYAPELNPAEYAWSHLKYSRLHNFVLSSVDHLNDVVHHELEEISRDRRQLRGFFRAAPLDFQIPAFDA